MTLEVQSPAFVDGAAMPTEYTCEGEDCSPELRWDGAPAGTRSFALIVEDPDAPDPAAPKLTWVHWVVVDLPASCTGLPRAVQALPAGAREGLTDFKRTGYGGPCPPVGRHRYFHRLYALDCALPGLEAPTAAQLRAAMAGHVLAEASLMGTYEKRARRR